MKPRTLVYLGAHAIVVHTSMRRSETISHCLCGVNSEAYYMIMSGLQCNSLNWLAVASWPLLILFHRLSELMCMLLDGLLSCESCCHAVLVSKTRARDGLVLAFGIVNVV